VNIAESVPTNTANSIIITIAISVLIFVKVPRLQPSLYTFSKSIAVLHIMFSVEKKSSHDDGYDSKQKPVACSHYV
jgi:hypothetical protein